MLVNGCLSIGSTAESLAKVACQSYVGSYQTILGTLGLGVVLALVIRHRVAFRVTIVPCILTVFLLGVLLHWWFMSRPL
jgi:uncharacterized membrane protein (Fun14 family)